MITAASLGQLAVHYRMIREEDRLRLREELAPAALLGTPTSFARLLLRQGLTREIVAQLLAAGGKLGGVRCDNCGAVIPQGTFAEPREYACSTCDCLLLGFRVFSDTVPPLTHPDAQTVTDEGSGELAPIGTAHFPQVLPLPRETIVRTPEDLLGPAPDDESTQAFGLVFQMPESIEERTDAEASAELDLMLAERMAEFDPEGETGRLTPAQQKAVADAKRVLERRKGKRG